jgi:hypothetical protein
MTNSSLSCILAAILSDVLSYVKQGVSQMGLISKPLLSSTSESADDRADIVRSGAKADVGPDSRLLSGMPACLFESPVGTSCVGLEQADRMSIRKQRTRHLFIIYPLGHAIRDRLGPASEVRGTYWE